MRKGNKEQAMETLNPYERNIKKSLTSLVDSQKNEKRKKKVNVVDNWDADYATNLGLSGEEDQVEEGDRVTTPTRNKATKKMRKNKELDGAECQQDESATTPVNQATTKPSKKYDPPATLKRYVNLTKHQRQGSGKSEKRKAPTVGELIMRNKLLPKEASMENTIPSDGETGDQTLNEANLDWLSKLDDRANANRDMEEFMAESEDESDEESAAEEQVPEYDIDADPKRGPTMLHKVHMRSFEKHEAIILNEFGQPIGPVTPDKDTMGEFSRFLGTISCDYGTSPLLHRTWKLVPN
ncbi:Phage-like element PBSX protein XkdK [Bienertia sinuspersici]